MKNNIDLLKPHFSTSDWDFSSANWELTALNYVSAPTSLHSTLTDLLVLCRLPLSLCLPVGRMTTWIIRDNTYPPCITFRHQTALGDASNQAAYRIRFNSATITRLYYWDGAAETLIDSWATGISAIDWTRNQITWWNGVNLQGLPALCVEYHKWADPNWQSQGIRYDTNNRHKDSDINRCGFQRLHKATWVDDTEIWIPV